MRFLAVEFWLKPLQWADRGRSYEKSAPPLESSSLRHQPLDLIRGLAAFSVSQYHFMAWNGVAHIQSMGTFAVYVFFVLSGLTMMMVYGGRFASGIDQEKIARFYTKRLARLLPLLLVVALLAYARSMIAGQGDVAAAILTGTGLMALHMPGFVSNSVGAWSLGIELAFYAVFPVVVLLARTWKGVAIATAILVIAQQLILWKLRAVSSIWPFYISNLTFAPFFAIGILIWFDKGDRKIAMAPVALVMLSVLIGFSAIVKTNLMRDQASYIFLTAVAGVAIWSAWRAEIPSVLEWPASFLGNVSYSLYLTHWIANDISSRMGLPLPAQWAAYIFIALTGAWISYTVFENPMRSWWTRERRRQVATLP